jgi:hypothetical protein
LANILTMNFGKVCLHQICDGKTECLLRWFFTRWKVCVSPNTYFPLHFWVLLVSWQCKPN